jgi:hypothetical protein
LWPGPLAGFNSYNPKICNIQTSNIWEANLKTNQLNYTSSKFWILLWDVVITEKQGTCGELIFWALDTCGICRFAKGLGLILYSRKVLLKSKQKKKKRRKIYTRNNAMNWRTSFKNHDEWTSKQQGGVFELINCQGSILQSL